MRAALRSASVVLMGLLGACSHDSRGADLKQCSATMGRQSSQTQAANPGETEEQRHDKLGNQIAACMENLGYRHDNNTMTDERCVDDVDFNPYCYRR